jgi:hypothetical protein
VTTNTSEEGNIKVDFAAAPNRFDAKTIGGSINVILPRGPETYRLQLTSNTSGASSLPNDPASSRTITAVASDGNIDVHKAI